MKRYAILALAAVAFTTSSAFAVTLTVKEGDVANKIREVSLQNVRLRGGNATILADARGMSVYTFDADGDNRSNCSGRCLRRHRTFFLHRHIHDFYLS